MGLTQMNMKKILQKMVVDRVQVVQYPLKIDILSPILILTQPKIDFKCLHEQES